MLFPPEFFVTEWGPVEGVGCSLVVEEIVLLQTWNETIGLRAIDECVWAALSCIYEEDCWWWYKGIECLPFYVLGGCHAFNRSVNMYGF